MDRQQVSEPSQGGQIFCRTSGGDSGHGYGPTIQGPRGEHGVLPGANATAGRPQCYTGGHGGMTGTSNICAGCSNNGPSFLAAVVP